MLTITKEFLFDAAHKLWRHDVSPEENLKIYGNCAKLHGHTYRLQITIKGPVKEDGMILNFTELKAIVTGKVISRYDHSFLNDMEEYRDLPVTAENMAGYIFKVLDREMMSHGVILQSVVLYETPTSWATMTREGDDA